MKRLRAALLLTVLVAVGLPMSMAQGATKLELRPVTDAVFPDRVFVLTLPERRPLQASDLDVTENGNPVFDVRVAAGAAGASAVVLAIDASRSMQGKPIRDAMEAARRFAAERRPEQKLGVVFFSRNAQVALKPTADAAQIDSVLSNPPAITSGTQVFSAAKTAIDLAVSTGAVAPTVVLLSDGCRALRGGCAPSNSGTAANATVGPKDVAKLAEKEGVRVFSVGLRSKTYDAAALRSVASADSYLSVANSAGLASVYERLGERFGNEYVVSYRSPAPVGSRVGVGMQIRGISGLATAAYQVPDLIPNQPTPVAEEGSIWRSSGMAIAVGVLVSLLVALALLLVVRPRTRTIGQRISSFVFHREHSAPLLQADHHVPSFSNLVDSTLKNRRSWDELKLDVELAGLKANATQIAGIAIGGGLIFVLIGLLVERPVISVVGGIGFPVATRMVVRRLGNRVRARFADQLPDNLQVLSSAMRAGHSFVGALKVMVNDAPEPSASEYRRVLRDEQLGLSIEDSLNVVSERMKNDEVAYIGLIATLQRDTGGNTAEVFDRVTETIRERQKLKRLISTLTAQGRFGGWIVTLLPIAMVVFLNVVKPDYMDPMLERTAGWVVLIVGALMVVSGALVIRKIVDIKV